MSWIEDTWALEVAPPCSVVWSDSTSLHRVALETWRAVTAATDQVLNTLDTAALEAWLPRTRQPQTRTVGSTVQRVIYHYWSHIGEIIAIRQILGHADVPEFVGDIDGEAPYRAEPLPVVRVLAEAGPAERG